MTERVREMMELGDFKFEVEGPRDYVKPRMEEQILRLIPDLKAQGRHEDAQRLLSIVTTQPESVYETIEVTSYDEPITIASEYSLTDIRDFYVKTNPRTQQDAIVAITYFYDKYLSKSSVEVEDYQEAFKVLRKVAADEPTNLKSTVQNTLRRSNYLYSADRGRYELTLQGEQYIENYTSNTEE